MAQQLPDSASSGLPPRERDHVAILIFVVASAVFILAVLSLKLGVTPFALSVKLSLFGAACVLSVISMGLALWSMLEHPRDLFPEEGSPEGSPPAGASPEGARPNADPGRSSGPNDETSANPSPADIRLEHRHRLFRHRRIRRGALSLAVAMLLTAASAVGELPARERTPDTGPTKTVTIAPQVDLRGTKLVLGGRGTARPGRAASRAGKAFGEVFAIAFKQALSDLVGESGGLLSALAKADITISPNFYFGEGGRGGSPPSLNALVAALEKTHINLVLNGWAGTPSRPTPTDCARYYVELDKIADDEPQIASHWPGSSTDEARACGLGNSQAMARFLGYLTKR